MIYLDQQRLSDAEASEIVAYPTIGAWAGYAVTTLLTRSLVEPLHAKGTASPRGMIRDVAISPLVVPAFSDNAIRWTWPGLTVSLR